MTTPLTFGVEFEMSVANGIHSGRGYHTDKRIIDFDVDGDDELFQDEPLRTPSKDSDVFLWPEPWKPIARHMAATLRAAGFNSSVDKEDNSSWDFTTDVSIEDPDTDLAAPVAYTYEGVELRSPAMYFTPESLQAVADVLKLLKRTYIINTNISTGLHVHVGDGKKGWPFHMIQRLMAFVWAFEPQLITLFPPSRVDGNFTKTMRTSTPFVRKFVRENGRRPTSIEGLVWLFKSTALEQVYTLFMPDTFRMSPTAEDSNGTQNRKPTVEWRHHEGTMDEVSVCMWIKTAVGTMDFLRSVEPATFTKLLSIVECEHWEKKGDGLDGERERKMGPILAEDGFTIIDLLRTIGLYGPAKYYKERGIYRIEVDSKRQQYLPV